MRDATVLVEFLNNEMMCFFAKSGCICRLFWCFDESGINGTNDYWHHLLVNGSMLPIEHRLVGRQPGVSQNNIFVTDIGDKKA
jgi:hypothetical protein